MNLSALTDPLPKPEMNINVNSLSTNQITGQNNASGCYFFIGTGGIAMVNQWSPSYCYDATNLITAIGCGVSGARSVIGCNLGSTIFIGNGLTQYTIPNTCGSIGQVLTVTAPNVCSWV